MTQLNLDLLGAATRTLTPRDPLRVAAPSASAGAENRFQAALGRAEPHIAGQQISGQVQTPLRVAEAHKVAQAFAPVPVNPAAAPTVPRAPTAPVSPSLSAEAADQKRRAREALELDAGKLDPAAPETGGDAILGGLQRLRGVFDRQTSRLNAAMSGANDTSGLIGLQVEVVNFSLMVEVASKLTGKSTSALESLMKGQ